MSRAAVESPAGPSGKEICAQSLSSPEFLHKRTAVVKNTGGEKVGKTEKNVESDYVNQLCISTGVKNCGKLLWKSLWRMWKTKGFQQVFGLCAGVVLSVENSAYRFA